MADDLTTAEKNRLLDYSLTSVKVGLFTSQSTSAEVSGGSYARQSVSFASASGGSASPSADIDFPAATADWGTITYGAILNGSGDVRWWLSATSSKTVDDGDQLTVARADLTVSL